MKKDYELSEQDHKFMASTACMIKDVMLHCVASYLKEGDDDSKHALFIQNVLINTVGNALFEVSADDFFLNHCLDFAACWERWIKNAEKSFKQIKKGAH